MIQQLIMTPKSVFSIEIEEEEEEESDPFSFMVCIYAVLSTVALLSSLSTSHGIIELSLSLSSSPSPSLSLSLSLPLPLPLCYRMSKGLERRSPMSRPK